MLNNKDGFTLIEIVIVIIIVGVLASLALPRFFSTIEYSRSAEALNSLGVIRKSIERCGLVTNNLTGCNTFTALDIDDPGTSVGNHFTYNITINNVVTKEFTLTATRNSLEGGNAGDTIVLAVLSTGIFRSGTGAFQPIR